MPALPSIATYMCTSPLYSVDLHLIKFPLVKGTGVCYGRLGHWAVLYILNSPGSFCGVTVDVVVIVVVLVHFINMLNNI